MNLRVELILDEEKRSASVITVKSVARIASIVVPIILVLIIAAFAYSLWQLGNEVKALEDKLAVDKPRKEKSLDLQGQLGANQQVLAELEGWQKSQMDVRGQIVAVQKEAPAKIQLTSLVLSHEMRLTNGAPARVFTMSLKGKAFTESAQVHVTKLQAAFLKGEAFTNFVESAKVTDFRRPENVTDENSTERSFQINCVYKPRLLARSEAPPRKPKKEEAEEGEK